MMERKPNEVLVSVEVLHDLMAVGGARTWRVDRGPSDEARLVNVRWAGQWVVLEYDRPVDEPALSLVHVPTGQHPGEIGTTWTG